MSSLLPSPFLPTIALQRLISLSPHYDTLGRQGRPEVTAKFGLTHFGAQNFMRWRPLIDDLSSKPVFNAVPNPSEDSHPIRPAPKLLPNGRLSAVSCALPALPRLPRSGLAALKGNLQRLGGVRVQLRPFNHVCPDRGAHGRYPAAGFGTNRRETVTFFVRQSLSGISPPKTACFCGCRYKRPRTICGRPRPRFRVSTRLNTLSIPAGYGFRRALSAIKSVRAAMGLTGVHTRSGHQSDRAGRPERSLRRTNSKPAS